MRNNANNLKQTKKSTIQLPQNPEIISRCPWCGSDPTYITYHDNIWGVPVFDDRQLFEFLILESAQAGLSWITILKRQEGYRAAFCQYNVEQVAALSAQQIQHLLKDSRIIRNKKKIESAVNNARCFLDIQKQYGTFASYYWQFTEGISIQNAWSQLDQIPSSTPLSIRISTEMRKKGFQFIGPTVMYAYMQATGMVNDHLISCFRYNDLKRRL